MAPQGGRLREVAPVGGVGFNQSRLFPSDRQMACSPKTGPANKGDSG